MAEVIRSRDELYNDLKNGSFAVYVYIGLDTDKGWQVAEVVEGLVQRLRVYRTQDSHILDEWLKDHTKKGIVFGIDDEPKKELSLSQTEDFVAVLQAIKAAW